MTTTLAPPSRATTTDIDRALDALSKGYPRLASASAGELIRLANECIEGTMRVAHEWVDQSARFKGVPAASGLRAEDISAGPVATIRQLRLVIQSLQDIASSGRPRLNGEPKNRARRAADCPGLSRQGHVRQHHVSGIQSRRLDEAGHHEGIAAALSRRRARQLESRQSENLPRAGGGQCLVDSHDRRLHQALPGGAARSCSK